MSEDYTGILIKDTYQNVLHKGQDGKVYDGLGNEYTFSITSSMDSSSYSETSSYIQFSNVDNVPDFVLESETSSISVLFSETSSYSELSNTSSYINWNNVDNVPDFVLESETSSIFVISSSYSITSSYIDPDFISEKYNGTAGLLFEVSASTNGSSSLTILETGSAWLYEGGGFTGSIGFYEVPPTTLNFVPNTTNYLVIDYNNGTPVWDMLSNATVANLNGSSVALAGTFFPSSITGDTHGIMSDIARGSTNRIISRLISTNKFERAGGLLLSESGSQAFSVSAGTLWYGIQFERLDLVNSQDAGSEVDFWSKNGGVWSASMDSGKFVNDQYCDGIDTLPLPNNDYVNNWVYRFITPPTGFLHAGTGKHVAIVLGNAYNSLSGVVAESPVVPPPEVSSNAILVGRIIAREGVGSAVRVESAFSTEFVGNSVTSHNDLSDLQGGTTDQYYHLTLSEYNSIILSGEDVTLGQITSSTLIVSESTNFGNSLDDSHTFTGSVNITGSLIINGSPYSPSTPSSSSTSIFQTTRVSTNYTASVRDFILCDTISGSFSILLPNSDDDSVIGIKNIKNLNSVTIYTEGSEEVDENDTPLILTGKSSAQLICNSNIWYII